MHHGNRNGLGNSGPFLFCATVNFDGYPSSSAHLRSFHPRLSWHAIRVEGQVASGDWGTPSEYVRELIRQDKERRLGKLEQELIAAAKGRKIELPVSEIRPKGLIAALRERTRQR